MVDRVIAGDAYSIMMRQYTFAPTVNPKGDQRRLLTLGNYF